MQHAVLRRKQGAAAGKIAGKRAFGPQRKAAEPLARPLRLRLEAAGRRAQRHLEGRKPGADLVEAALHDALGPKQAVGDALAALGDAGDKHVRPQMRRRALEGAVAVATLSLLCLLFWFGWDLAYRVRFQNLAGLEIPISYAYAAIPVGSLISMVAVVAHNYDPRRNELETAV